jgi:hypothetical protein
MHRTLSSCADPVMSSNVLVNGRITDVVRAPWLDIGCGDPRRRQEAQDQGNQRDQDHRASTRTVR